LPEKEPPPTPPWCRECDPVSRTILIVPKGAEPDDARPARCPRCNPNYSTPLTERFDQARALGQWWIQHADEREPAPWCGRCDQRTRMVASSTLAGAMTRCPCHPRYGQPTETDQRTVSRFVTDDDLAAPRPPWCTYCSDPERRQVDRGDGSPLIRCPACHPLAGRPTKGDARPVTDPEGDAAFGPAATARPPWCTRCSDPERRQVDRGDGRPMRCPTCHPLAAEPLPSTMPEAATAAPAPVIAAAAAHIRVRMRRHRDDGWSPEVATEGRPKADA